MLPRNHPDRIGVSFDDHRLVANAGLLLPATLAHHLGLHNHVIRAGAGQHGGQDTDALPRWRAAPCAARRDGHDQGAIHPGHLPAQFSLGPRPSTGPGEPGVAGTRLAGQRRTRRLGLAKEGARPTYRKPPHRHRHLFPSTGPHVRETVSRRGPAGQTEAAADVVVTKAKAWAAGGRWRRPRSGPSTRARRSVSTRTCGCQSPARR